MGDRECYRSRGPGDAGPAGLRPEAVAARIGAAGDLEGALSRGVCRRGGVVRSSGARQRPGREPQRPAAELLLPAAAAGGGLPGVAPVLPEPPPVSAERAPRARGKESHGAVDGRAAPALAGAAGLHALRAGLRPRAGKGRPAGTRSKAGPMKLRSVTRKTSLLNQAVLGGVHRRGLAAGRGAGPGTLLGVVAVDLAAFGGEGHGSGSCVAEPG